MRKKVQEPEIPELFSLKEPVHFLMYFSLCNTIWRTDSAKSVGKR